MKRTLLVCICIFLSLNVFSQDSGGGNLDTFSVGISVFDGESLSANNHYLQQSIPILLSAYIRPADVHILSDTETNVLIENHHKDKILKKKKQITALHDQRDSLLFDDSPASAQYDSLTKKIQQESRELEVLIAAGPQSTIENKKIEISFTNDPAEGKQLYEIKEPLQQVCESNNLDYLVTGVLDQIENYLIIELSIYSAVEEKRIFTYEVASGFTEIESSVKKSAIGIIGHIMNREWSLLEINADREASIFVNDTFFGIGSNSLEYFYPGKYEIRVQKSGFEIYQTEVELGPGEIHQLEVELVKQSTRSVRVSSAPKDADVYINSLWAGKTPLETEAPDTTVFIVIKKEGYMDYKRILKSGDNAAITVNLIRSIVDENSIFQKRKNEFYDSMAMFALSVGVSVVLKGIEVNQTEQYLQYYDGTESPEQDAALRDLGIIFYTYQGSVFINGVLFVNMLYKLNGYIEAGEATAR